MVSTPTNQAINKLQFPIRAQFWCSPWIRPFGYDSSSLMAECTHDRPLNLWIVRILQCLSSWILSDINNTQKSCSNTKFTHFIFVVTAFQFALHFVVIVNSELLSSSHWAQLIVPSLHQIALIYREGIHIIHTSPRLLRKDWADLQKRLCEKNSQSDPSRLQSVLKVFRVFAFELTSGQWTCSTENRTITFCEFQHHPFRYIVPVSLGIFLHW